VRARYNSGAALPDLLRAEAVVLDTQQRVRAAQVGVAVEKAQLAVLMGRPSLDNVSFDESLLAEASPALVGESVDTRIEQARMLRPDRKAAELAVEHGDTFVRLAKRNRWPGLELMLGYQQQGLGNNAIQPATVSLGVAAPLPFLYQNQGELARAAADAAARNTERQRCDHQIAITVRTSLASVSFAIAQTQNAEQRLERARRAADLVRVQYEQGATSLVDLLEATSSAIDAEDNFLEAKENLWSLVFQLEYDVGKEFVK